MTLLPDPFEEFDPMTEEQSAEQTYPNLNARTGPPSTDYRPVEFTPFPLDLREQMIALLIRAMVRGVPLVDIKAVQQSTLSSARTRHDASRFHGEPQTFPAVCWGRPDGYGPYQLAVLTAPHGQETLRVQLTDWDDFRPASAGHRLIENGYMIHPVEQFDPQASGGWKPTPGVPNHYTTRVTYNPYIDQPEQRPAVFLDPAKFERASGKPADMTEDQ